MNEGITVQWSMPFRLFFGGGACSISTLLFHKISLDVITNLQLILVVLPVSLDWGTT